MNTESHDGGSDISDNDYNDSDESDNDESDIAATTITAIATNIYHIVQPVKRTAITISAITIAAI